MARVNATHRKLCSIGVHSPLHIAQYKATPEGPNLQNVSYVTTLILDSGLLSNTFPLPLAVALCRTSSLPIPPVSSANDQAHPTPFLNLASSTASASVECRWSFCLIRPLGTPQMERENSHHHLYGHMCMGASAWKKPKKVRENEVRVRGRETVSSNCLHFQGCRILGLS